MSTVPKNDLSGQTFGRWLIYSYSPSENKRHRFWNCECQCGNRKRIREDHIFSGRSSSCGCRRAEVTVTRNTTHGFTHTSLYVAWNHVKRRCLDSTDPAYKNYGGRGITIAHEFIESFEAFYKELGDPPFLGASIDRIDNLNGYIPGNLRWATRKEQSRNRRNNIIVTHNGESKCLAEWCEILNLNYKTVYQKVRSSGLPTHEVLGLKPSLPNKIGDV